MSYKQARNATEGDERLAALITNTNAVRAITAAVEGTIGPKGLDTMLVDRFGEVIITNDGVTILDKMDVNHPAAKLVINIAKAQQNQIGDGTTTATITAGALVGEGANQVLRGVPVARVIEGIKFGVQKAYEEMQKNTRTVTNMTDPALRQVALVASRDNSDIADLVVKAADMIGREKLLDPAFKLSDTITAEEGASNEVFLGVIVDKERMNKEMPPRLENVSVLIIDDALEPEEIEDEALSTEAGFNRYLTLQAEFKDNVHKIIELGVGLVLTDRGVQEGAEEVLTDAGVIVVQRVSAKDLRRAAEHTGARMIKRTGLKKSDAEIAKCLGRADLVYEDEKLAHVRVVGGKGKPMATVLVGAATAEVVGERERIAKDAASSVQATVKNGYVPGGGASELAVSRAVARCRDNIKGMAAYGVDCVAAALRRPLAQIVANAGYNPLEKVEEVLAAQTAKNMDSLAVDCDTGEVTDMLAVGVLDPTLVKLHAIKAAGEVAVAILRIDTIIKKKEEGAVKTEAGSTGSDHNLPDF